MYQSGAACVLSLLMTVFHCSMARRSDTIDMGLPGECNGDVRTVTGAMAVFQPETGERWHGLECQVIFRAQPPFVRLQLHVLDLDLPDVTLSRLCNDALYIYDGNRAYGSTFKQAGGAEGLCGSVSTQQQGQEMRRLQPQHLVLVSSGSYLTVHLRTDKSGPRGKGVRFIVTAFVDTPASGGGGGDKKMTMCAQSYGGFRCNNSRCVDRDLVCDGVDHCADESDESQHAPSYCLSTDQGNSLIVRFFSIGVTAAVAIVIGSLVVGLGFVFSLIYCLRRSRQSSTGTSDKRRSRSRGGATMASASVLINNGSHSNVSIGVAPPPYHTTPLGRPPHGHGGYYQLQHIAGSSTYSPACSHSQVSFQSCANSHHHQLTGVVGGVGSGGGGGGGMGLGGGGIRTPSSTRSARSQGSSSVMRSTCSHQRHHHRPLPISPPILPVPDWSAVDKTLVFPLSSTSRPDY